jgi:hypothetical protein
MTDDDLIAQDQESRRAFVQALREENEKRKGELAAERAFDGPEPVDWRQRWPRQEPEPVATARSSLTRDDVVEIVDKRMRQWIEQERGETEQRITAAIDALEIQGAEAFEEIGHALDSFAKRIREDMNNSDAARRAAVEAMRARYDVLEARLKLMLVSENATVVEPMRPPSRRTN